MVRFPDTTAQVATCPPFFPIYATQSQSPLFQLPPELRLQIFRLVLTPENDRENPYPFSSYYYRPTDIARRRYHMELVQSCKRVWMEALEIIYRDVIGEETFYWGWEERRPKDYRHYIGNKPEDEIREHNIRPIEDEDEESEEGSDEEMEDESEEEEGEVDEEELFDEENGQTTQGMVHPSVAAEQRTEDDREVENESDDIPMSEDDHSSTGTHDWWPASGVWNTAGADDSMSDIDTTDESAPLSTPYSSNSTDHPWQHHRHRHYLPHQWANIHTIRIFPQMFAFSVSTFAMFFTANPLLQPKTVHVIIRYTDWWSWEDNLRHDIGIGMRPGFAGMVILPESCTTFILELETCESKLSELEDVITGIKAEREEWRWARTDGHWLEYVEDPALEATRSWVGPTIYYDENTVDEDNIYGAYRFPHHPMTRMMGYHNMSLVWKVGSKEPGVEEGEILQLGSELLEYS